MLLKPVADAEVQCNDEVFEEVPPELRTVSREGIPVARETIISTQLNGRIGELEEQVRELQVALHLSEERCKAEARRHEEEVAALRAAFAREAEELRRALRLELEAELAKMKKSREELVRKTTVVRKETVRDDVELEVMRAREEKLKHELEVARQECRMTVAVYVKAETDWQVQLDKKAKFIEMLRARGTELQRIIDTYENITTSAPYVDPYIVPGSEERPPLGPYPVEERELPKARPVGGGFEVIDVRRAVADLPFGTDPESDDVDRDRKIKSFGLGAAHSEPSFHPAPTHHTSGRPGRFHVRRPAQDSQRRVRPLFDIPEERPSSIANSSGGFKRAFL
jgi:hypothetical protein